MKYILTNTTANYSRKYGGVVRLRWSLLSHSPILVVEHVVALAPDGKIGAELFIGPFNGTDHTYYDAKELPAAFVHKAKKTMTEQIRKMVGKPTAESRS